MGRTGYSQGHVQDLVGLWLPDPSEQLLKVGHEGDARAYRTGGCLMRLPTPSFLSFLAGYPRK